MPDKQARYREVTSCSNTTDYQGAQRLRALPAGGVEVTAAGTTTLNGTAVAVGRTIIAIMENYQQPDGSFAVPEVLRPFGAPEQITAQSLKKSCARGAASHRMVTSHPLIPATPGRRSDTEPSVPGGRR